MRMNNRIGQATTEMVFLLPLLVVLAAGCAFVAYICSQGLKVQEAANLGARIAGQETVGGAKDLATLQQDNGGVTSFGVSSAGDTDPSTCDNLQGQQQQQCLNGILNQGGALGTKASKDFGQGVYWNYRKLIYNLFNRGEQSKLYVPLPKQVDGMSEVRVARIMQPPQVFGWKPPTIKIEAKGYGGEDTYMYSLPRFGRTGNNASSPFWQQLFNGTDGNAQNRPSLKDNDPNNP